MPAGEARLRFRRLPDSMSDTFGGLPNLHRGANLWSSRYCKWLVALAFAVTLSSPAMAKRVALVVGISDYAHSPRLSNPGNDARGISTSLTRLGFEVITSLDAGLQGMLGALDQFYSASSDAEVALFYFAGHALQVRGTNYLIPADAQLRSESRLPQETIELQNIVLAMEKRARITLTFLDACRDNPLAETLQRSILGASRSAAVPRGLAPMAIRNPDSLVVFAAAPGKTASDGAADNSPFTTAMLRHIETPGEDIELVMKRVTREVHQSTGGEQTPERLSRLTSDFSFHPVSVPRPAAPPPTSVSAPLEQRPASAAPCSSDNPPITCLWARR